MDIRNSKHVVRYQISNVKPESNGFTYKAQAYRSHKEHMPVTEAALLASMARLLQPLTKDLYEGAKKFGASGLRRWDQKGFTAKLAKRMRAIEQVRTIWRPEGPISLRDFFHPPKLRIANKATRIARISELPSNAIVIEGIVGQGKSILMRSLAVEELAGNDAKWLPVFLELKDLSPKLGLQAAILKQLDSYDIDVDENSLNYLFGSGKMSLLLDGFDELEDSIVKETFLEIEFLVRKYPELRLIVSCRPGHEIQKSSAFEILPISPLVESEYNAFLERLKVDPKKSLALRQAIKNSPSKISSLITTPLMLTLVVLVYESDSQIPETLPEFFDGLFQLVFSRHDRLKANFNRKHYSGLSEKKLQTLFEAFSFLTLQMGYSRTLTQNQFDEVFDLAISYTENTKCESQSFKQDITRVACLMLEEGVDSITYLHKSILEYYAAAFVKRLNDEAAQLFFSSVMDKPHNWDEVLVFLRAIDPVRYARYYLLPVVESHYKKVVSIVANSDNDGLVKLAGILYPGIGASYEKRGDVYERTMIGGFRFRAGEEIGTLGYLLMEAIKNAAPEKLADLELAFGRLQYDRDSDRGVHIPVTQLFTALGTVELRKAFDVFEARLQRYETEGRATVAGEERKKLMFAAPPGKKYIQ